MERMIQFVFNKGDRVLVSGSTDGMSFLDEPGTIVEDCSNESFSEESLVAVTFDSWCDGWGPSGHTWGCHAKTIYPIPKDEGFVDQKSFCMTIDQLFEE